ncbi:MAG: DUF4132 domain-containing protein [Bacteroidota bacterium]
MNIQQIKHDLVIRQRDAHLNRNLRDYPYTPNPNWKQENEELINYLAAVALGEKPWKAGISDKLSDTSYHNARQFLHAILYGTNPLTPNRTSSFLWSVKDALIQKLLWYKHLTHPETYHLCWGFVSEKLTQSCGPECDDLITWILDQGTSDKELVEAVLIQSSYRSRFSPFQYRCWETGEDQVLKESGISLFIKPRIHPTSSLLGLIKQKGLGETLHHIIEKATKNSRIWNDKFKLYVLSYLYENAPKLLEGRYEVYLINTGYGNYTSPNLPCLFYLLEKDAKKFERYALDLVPESEVGEREYKGFAIYQRLNEHLPGKYDRELCSIGEGVLKLYAGPPPKDPGYFFFPNVKRGKPLPEAYSAYLLHKDRDSGIKRIMQFVQESFTLTPRYLIFLHKQLGKDAVPILIEAMKKESKIVDRYNARYFKTLFNLFKKHDISSFTEEIIDYALQHANKKTRRMATDLLAKYQAQITDRAEVLLKGKVKDRIVGALLLSHSQDPAMQQKLLQLIDTERNDDTRDILLEALARLKFDHPYSRAEVETMIDGAEKRKKLSHWREKWLEEADLPPLYWKDSRKALSAQAIRFLFYRSKRPKGLGLNSDIEARQLISHLDKQRSGKFALALLQAFQNSNVDSKCKYYMTLAGLMGNDEILNKLHTLFRKSMSERRYKMGEYCVGAMVMIGSNKALRIVELISRKFTSKRPRISRAAIAALDIVSQELNLSREQLGDRIIPDFDFENLYKTFEVEGESYRAFVSKEFKLHYFDPNNKLRKSPPKGTPKELLAEFKAINKEIKEVVRTQKGRLEQFLVNERKWPVDEWQEYYAQNPIMLIYVQRLLWGLYRQEELIHVFYCDDDIEFYDVDDEEVDLAEGDHIGIVHPLHMAPELLAQWRDKAYEMDLAFEFPLLGRGVHTIPDSEHDRSQTLVLSGTDIPKGADFVAGFLEKRGWKKESADGGFLSFVKVNPYTKLQAWANIDGPAAYYRGVHEKATIYEVVFQGEDIYKPPKLAEIPPVFYSEIIEDLTALSKA